MFPYDRAWLKRHTCRELLENVVQQLDATLPFDLVESVTLTAMEEKIDVTGSGRKRRRNVGHVDATRLQERNVMFVIDATQSENFKFEVTLQEVRRARPTIDAFSHLRAAQSRSVLHLPNHLPKPANEVFVLENDIISWLAERKLGWPRAELNVGKEFLRSIANALFPLTLPMFEALSDPGNAREVPRLCIAE